MCYYNELYLKTGSPIQFTVGKTPYGGIHRIEVSGAGVERGYVGAKSLFINLVTLELTLMINKRQIP